MVVFTALWRGCRPGGCARCTSLRGPCGSRASDAACLAARRPREGRGAEKKLAKRARAHICGRVGGRHAAMAAGCRSHARRRAPKFVGRHSPAGSARWSELAALPANFCLAVRHAPLHRVHSFTHPPHCRRKPASMYNYPGKPPAACNRHPSPSYPHRCSGLQSPSRLWRPAAWHGRAWNR